MRTRTRDLGLQTQDVTGVQLDQRWDNADPPNVTEVETPLEFSETVFTGEETTNDVVTPNYLKLRAMGYIINNPYDHTVESVKHGVLVYSQDYGWRNINSTLFGHFYNSNTALLVSDINNIPGYLACPDDVDVDSLSNQAITAAWAKVIEAPFQSFVTAAEMYKTVRTLTGLFQSLFKVIRATRAARKRIPLHVFNSTAKVASIWLEARYGIRPLVYEIRGAIDAYNAIGDKRRTRYTAAVQGSSEYHDTQSWNAGNAEFESNFTIDRVSTRDVVCRAGVLTHEFGDKIGMSQSFGMGVDQILSGVWEVIPYSFVWDWFFNTAKFVAAWSPKIHQEVLTSWLVVDCNDIQTRKVTNWERGKISFSNPTWVWLDPTATTIGHSSPDVMTTSTRERIPKPERPTIPSLNVRLNVAKLLDILALSVGLSS
jgi:hypothetical protein